MKIRFTALTISIALAGAMANADEHSPSYSPNVGTRGATQVYWGDTHVHSSWSPDASAFGNSRLGPDDAFRFAAGEEVTAHNGMRVRLRRPLDFVMVSDHSEYMALFPRLAAGDPVLLETDAGKRWYEAMAEGGQAAVFGEFMDALVNNRDVLQSERYEQSVWDAVVANADRHDRPGVFTAFIGYEWTSMPGAANLHRNVVYRDGADVAGRMPPFSSLDSNRPEDLWAFMSKYEQETGGRILAIPHNSNMSAGLMFPLKDSDGAPLTRAYAEARRRYEPLVEASQVKGDSEAHPFLSLGDEFADYENWDENAGFSSGPHEDWMYQHEYVRPALALGLKVGEDLGANPFQFGLIASTDSHTSLATADESDFWGKFVSDEPSAGRSTARFGSRDTMASIEGMELAAEQNVRFNWSYVASGYAAVWAQENTREALFDAMQRRETYATTGPRMTVRFFGGAGFTEDDATAPDVARVGYAKGVPMGGELAVSGAAPSFLVAALRDPEGARLDRVQIIKGWLDAEGALNERIYDVAVSGHRKIGADGRCREPVGSTVDVAAAVYTNAIGASELTAVWSDPDFDPEEAAFFYVRVLEIPTPRWTTYDAAFFETALPKGAPATTQERAYTSAIWYTPSKRYTFN